MILFMLLFGMLGDTSDGSGGGPAPSVTLSFRRTPRLFGPKKVATVAP